MEIFPKHFNLNETCQNEVNNELIPHGSWTQLHICTTPKYYCYFVNNVICNVYYFPLIKSRQTFGILTQHHILDTAQDMNRFLSLNEELKRTHLYTMKSCPVQHCHRYTLYRACRSELNRYPSACWQLWRETCRKNWLPVIRKTNSDMQEVIYYEFKEDQAT